MTSITVRGSGIPVPRPSVRIGAEPLGLHKGGSRLLCPGAQTRQLHAGVPRRLDHSGSVRGTRSRAHGHPGVDSAALSRTGGTSSFLHSLPLVPIVSFREAAGPNFGSHGVYGTGGSPDRRVHTTVSKGVSRPLDAVALTLGPPGVAGPVISASDGAVAVPRLSLTGSADHSLASYGRAVHGHHPCRLGGPPGSPPGEWLVVRGCFISPHQPSRAPGGSTSPWRSGGGPSAGDDSPAVGQLHGLCLGQQLGRDGLPVPPQADRGVSSLGACSGDDPLGSSRSGQGEPSRRPAQPSKHNLTNSVDDRARNAPPSAGPLRQAASGSVHDSPQCAPAPVCLTSPGPGGLDGRRTQVPWTGMDAYASSPFALLPQAWQ